jgi:ABC-type nitrate/sulfonate/bicarbonate transport system permease component
VSAVPHQASGRTRAATRWAGLGGWALRVEWPVALALAILLVGLWQLVGTLGALPDYVFTPTQIVDAMVTNAGDLSSAAGASLKLIAAGFFIGAGLGALVGLLAGVFTWVEDLVEPLVAATYPLPKIALFPAFALWLGYTDTARIVVIAIGCFYPVFINAFASTRAIDPQLLMVAANAGAGRLRAFAAVIVPAALPRVIVGLRIALALAFVLDFSVEALASRQGLGTVIFLAFQGSDYGLMYAAIATFALLGGLADRLLVFAGRRAIHGQSLEMARGR